MKSMILAGLVAAGMPVAGPAHASADLAKTAGCTTACHAVDTKKAGPAFKDVAASYKGKKDAEARIVAKLKQGKGHPPSKASEDDLKKLVKWVMTT